MNDPIFGRLYSSMSNRFSPETENALWKMGSSLGNCTVPPTGTTTTCGLNDLPFMIMVAVAGFGLQARAVHVDDDVREVGGLAAALVDQLDLARDRTRACRPPGGRPAAGSARHARRSVGGASKRRDCTSGARPPPGGPDRVRRASPYNPPPMVPLSALVLAAATAASTPASSSVDGNAALRHASALASLGPHPWGSPRSRAAAAYVAAQLRGAGLAEVRQEDFEVKGVRGVQRRRRPQGRRSRNGRGGRPPRHRARCSRRVRRRRGRGRDDRGRAGDGAASAAAADDRVRILGRRRGLVDGLGTTTGSRAYVRSLARRPATSWPRSWSR